MDMLIRLYAVADRPPPPDVTVRRAMAYERTEVLECIKGWFPHTPGWVDECALAFARQPVACHIAIEEGKLVGFAVYDSTYRGFFGPIGVDPTSQSRGVGSALCIATLNAMSAVGYAYAVIGGVGAPEFFARLGATPIDGSDPGPYWRIETKKG